MFKIEIQGNPVPWAAHGGYGRRSFDKRANEKNEYRRQIRKQFANPHPLTVAVITDYIFFMPIPASTSKKQREKILQQRIHHTKKPDCSNLLKLAEDTLKGIVIADDSQVVRVTASKLYSERPRTEIHIELA